jgi:ankyrin repeat protein
MTGDTLLHAAVTRGNLDDVKILIASGARVNCSGDLGSTPLHYAASRGHREIAIELLRAGADPNVKNEFDQMPLDIAILMKRINVEKILRPRA